MARKKDKQVWCYKETTNGAQNANYKDIYPFCWWKANLALGLLAAN